MSKLILTLLSGCLLSCATAHKQNLSKQKGNSQDTFIKVSVEKNSQLSTKNFIVLEYTIENTSEEYKRYDSVDLAIDPKFKESVKIVVGQDLVNWSEGINNKIELDNFNYRTFIAGVSAIAGASAVLSKDPNYAKIAAGVAVAGFGTLAIDDFIEIRNSVKNSEKSDTRGLIPSSHILATPVSVPPNLFLKRFAVFHIKGKAKSEFYKMDMTFNGTKETPSIALNSKFDKAPLNNSLTCEDSPGTMRFRGFTIKCLNQCNVIHPLNRKNCVGNYTRKFLR